MSLKKGILAGAFALIVVGMSSVSYADAQGDICKKMWDSFQGMRKMTGLSEADASQFGKFSEFSKQILSETKVSSDTIKEDKNYYVLNGEVTYHADQIDKAASSQDLEEIQVQFRRLTIACRNCHKIYRSELNLVP